MSSELSLNEQVSKSTTGPTEGQISPRVTQITEDQSEEMRKVSRTSIDKIIKSFAISDDSLKAIKRRLNREFELGLRDEDSAAVKMLITYVRDLSRGDEAGTYLALDLGGTHFRVLLVTLGDHPPKVSTEVHDIPPEMIVTENGQELFDYIALKLLEFVQQHKLKRRRISLGFTFSFPCKQYGLTQSILVKWCKGFKVGNVIGTDVVKQLKNALKRQLAGLVEAYIDVVAVINDTTGTLVACANTNKDCRIGLIVGTGFNACYMERLDRCEKWPANYTNPKEVIINCEWGALGDNKNKREMDEFRNEFDRIIDAESINPQNQTYEKMLSGMYIGELLRLSMLRLYKDKQLFTSMQETTSSATKSFLGVNDNENKRLNNPSPKSRESSPLTASTSPGSNLSGKSALQGRRSRSNSSLGSNNGTSSPADNTSSACSTSSLDSTVACHKLFLKDSLVGRHLSMLAVDELSGRFEETKKVLQELNINKYSQSDLSTVVQLGAAIMNRSAYLVAAGVSTILERLKRPYTVIGYDGSVIKHHPYFLKRVTDKCAQLTQPDYRFDFVQSSDGSGIGAAVVAAALHRERRPLYVVKPGKLYEMHVNSANETV